LNHERLNETNPGFDKSQVNAKKVYASLRAQRGMRLLSISAEAASLGLPRETYKRALAALERAGWLTKQQEANGKDFVWKVNQATRSHLTVETFRGKGDILLQAAFSTLRPELTRDEERQLFLAFREEKPTAGLYLELRRTWAGGQEDGPFVAYTDLARRLGCLEATVRRRMTRLVHFGLVELDQTNAVIKLHFVTCVEDQPVDENELTLWLRDPALVPVPASNVAALLAKKTIGSQASLVLDFFYKATAAKGSKTDIGMAHAGAKVANERAARNLVRDATFKQLMGPLLFFVVDWAGEAVDNYGRTLVTFQKNLPAILEEYADNSTDRTYIQRLMKRMGLDAHFPVPEVKQPVQRVRELTEEDMKDIEGWEDEDITDIKRPYPVKVLTPEERKALRAKQAAFAKAMSYG
jgi:hypothetical protein